MNRIGKATVSLALAGGIAVTGVSVAGTADASTPHNGTDAMFLRSNEQVNLAEITIGRIVLNRAHGPAAGTLARKTVGDHRKARALNTALAKKIGIPVPTTPNAMQQKVAAHLKQAPRINREYFVAQIQGHRQSVTNTKYEIRHGFRPRVVAYAKTYLPIAEMHLMMAKRDLAAWMKLHPGQ